MESEEIKLLIDYRQDLLSTKQKTQDNYDKFIITLSGGAIAVTMPFFKDVVLKEGRWLLVAWICWAVSIFIAFYSMSTSIKAHEETVSIIDEGITKDEDMSAIFSRIEREIFDKSDRKTKKLNGLSKVVFILGFGFVGFFMLVHLSNK